MIKSPWDKDLKNNILLCYFLRAHLHLISPHQTSLLLLRSHLSLSMSASFPSPNCPSQLYSLIRINTRYTFFANYCSLFVTVSLWFLPTFLIMVLPFHQNGELRRANDELLLKDTYQQFHRYWGKHLDENFKFAAGWLFFSRWLNQTPELDRSQFGEKPSSLDSISGCKKHN